MISRRDFLKAAGITVIAAHVPSWLTNVNPTAAPTFDVLYGRVLRPLKQVWVDSIISITDIHADAFQTAHGWIDRSWVQPMLTPPVYHTAVYDPPFAAEVTGTVATMHRYCSPDAIIEHPRRVRIGHGGVLRVIDRLEYDGIAWYGVQQADDTQVYWTQSPPLALLIPPPTVPDLSIHVSRDDFRLTAFQRDRALFSVLLAAGESLPAGQFSVTEHLLGKRFLDQFEASTLLTFGDDLHIGGAYWHNRFGENTPGHAIQLPPYVAKWLYGAASIGTPVMIA